MEKLFVENKKKKGLYKEISKIYKEYENNYYNNIPAIYKAKYIKYSRICNIIECVIYYFVFLILFFFTVLLLFGLIVCIVVYLIDVLVKSNDKEKIIFFLNYKDLFIAILSQNYYLLCSNFKNLIYFFSVLISLLVMINTNFYIKQSIVEKKMLLRNFNYKFKLSLLFKVKFKLSSLLKDDKTDLDIIKIKVNIFKEIFTNLNLECKNFISNYNNKDSLKKTNIIFKFIVEKIKAVLTIIGGGIFLYLKFLKENILVIFLVLAAIYLTTWFFEYYILERKRMLLNEIYRNFNV